MFKYLGKEKRWIFPGILVSAINGAIMPIFGLILANIIGILTKFIRRKIDPTFTESKENILWDNDKYAISFFAIAILSWLANFF